VYCNIEIYFTALSVTKGVIKWCNDSNNAYWSNYVL